MDKNERFIVRVDYPTIGECRYFTHAGALSREYPDARQFPTKAKADRVARTLGSNAVVEPVTVGAQ